VSGPLENPHSGAGGGSLTSPPPSPNNLFAKIRPMGQKTKQDKNKKKSNSETFSFQCICYRKVFHSRGKGKGISVAHSITQCTYKEVKEGAGWGG